jgi:hypothetical protein
MIGIFSNTEFLYVDLFQHDQSITSVVNYDLNFVNSTDGTIYSINDSTPLEAHKRYFKFNLSTLSASMSDGLYSFNITLASSTLIIFSEVAYLDRTTAIDFSENNITTTYAVNEI